MRISDWSSDVCSSDLLDQIIQHFGPDAVAEVTGRSRRIVPRRNADGSVRFAVENRPASANLAETHAFMDDVKRILIFSEAGGPGRPYPAVLGPKMGRASCRYIVCYFVLILGVSV